jgi:ribosomal protein S18 acetylase RimI-like enzyme
MTASLILNHAPRNDGLQALDLSRHLGGMATLIELCFSATLDASGRGFIREMQFLSHAGPLLKMLDVVPLGSHWNKGYVWLERGQVVGCVATQRAAPQSRRWLIANVAVHPEQRRKGIAQAMMQATLDFIRGQGGAEVMLQVDDDNLGAISLYRQLGFTDVRTQTAWRRAATDPVPLHAPSPFDVRLRASSEWRAQLALAQQARPDGLQWNEPLTPQPFRPSLWNWVNDFFAGEADEHWMVEQHDQIIASLIVHFGATGGDRLTVLVHPAWAGQVERVLLVRGLRRLAHRPWPVNVDYATDDEAASAALRALDFQPGRILRWMKAEIR